MVRIFKQFLEHAFRQERVLFFSGSLSGWFISMRILLASPGVWSFLTGEFLAKTIVGLIISFVSGCLGVLAKDCIRWIKSVNKKNDKDNEKRKAA